MVENGNQVVSWLDVFVRTADDARYWDREVRRPAMLYLVRGKKGGEPTAAYEEDPMGLTTKIKSQLAGGGALEASPKVKRHKATKAEKAAAKAAAAARNAGQASSSSSAQQASPQHRSGANDPHPRKRGVYFVTTREGTEVCFTFAKNGRDACPEPCPHSRAHVCQHCLGPHRNGECQRANPTGKGGKAGKGK